MFLPCSRLNGLNQRHLWKFERCPICQAWGTRCRKYHLKHRPICGCKPKKDVTSVCSSIRHHFHQGSLFAACRRLALGQKQSKQNTLIQRLPKRTASLSESIDNGGALWGLEACEEISIAGVIFYHLVAFVTSFSIPLVVSVPFLSLFWVPLVAELTPHRKTD